MLRLNANPTNAIAAAVENSTVELEGEMKNNIRVSVPGGRTYRKGAIVRPLSRRNSTLRLRRRGDKVIVGYNFHRASRRGQAPAILSGRLINSIRGRRIAPFRGRVGVGVEYALPLDDPQGLDRPFFTSQVEKFRPVFYENIRRAWLLGK